MKATIILVVSVFVAVVVVYRMSYQVQIETKPKTEYMLQKDEIATVPQNTENSNKCKDHVDLKNIYSWDGTKWKQNVHVCKDCHDFLKATLKTQFGNTPIFIYEPKNDIYVSGKLKTAGTFEAEKSNGIAYLLKVDPELNFIDIGANIGVHTLAIAKMGRKVIAVEALDQNVHHLCASIQAGMLQENVTIIHNAITDVHGTVTLGVDKNNMGGTYVDVDSQHIKKLKGLRAQGKYGQVDTITMDDILQLPVIKEFTKVIVKMDIEGFEHKAIAKSEKFFKLLDVQGFVMEWEFHRNMETGKYILQSMKDLNFEPYHAEHPQQRLSVGSSSSWPYDVLWRRKV